MKIFEACELALKHLQKPATVDELYRCIKENHWYDFKSNQPREAIHYHLNKRTPDNDREDKDITLFVRENDKYRLYIPGIDDGTNSNAKESAKLICGSEAVEALEKEGISVIFESELDKLRFIAANKRKHL